MSLAPPPTASRNSRSSGRSGEERVNTLASHFVDAESQ